MQVIQKIRLFRILTNYDFLKFLKFAVLYKNNCLVLCILYKMRVFLGCGFLVWWCVLPLVWCCLIVGCGFCLLACCCRLLSAVCCRLFGFVWLCGVLWLVLCLPWVCCLFWLVLWVWWCCWCVVLRYDIMI